jgi:polyisoprenoid-binding protein YceI
VFEHLLIKTKVMNKKIFVGIGLAVTLLSFKANEPTTWQLDSSHAKVGFSISHMMVSDVEGYFKKVEATITASTADLTDAVATMSTDVASINTDNANRDAHLQKEDFFDAEKYPTIDFKSTSFTKTKIPNAYIIKGNLTMHGITKPVTLTAIAKFGKNSFSKQDIAGFKVTGKLNRDDYKIAPGMPAAALGKEITVNINAEFVKS